MNRLDDFFPNGFENWYETFYEIVSHISWLETECTYFKYPKLAEVIEQSGRGGCYIFAKELTDKFELKYEGVEWGIDEYLCYFDRLDEFLNKELNG